MKDLRTVYEDRTVPMTQISSIQKLLLTNRMRITASLICILTRGNSEIT